MCALVAARKIGRPHSLRHPLSGLVTCAACGCPLLGWPRGSLPPYPDGEPKREYRCRSRMDHPEYARACGRNHIDGRVADQAVAVAIVARLGDPRRADRIAAHLAQVREQRAEIEADIARWEATADELATKTPPACDTTRPRSPARRTPVGRRSRAGSRRPPGPSVTGSSGRPRCHHAARRNRRRRIPMTWGSMTPTRSPGRIPRSRTRSATRALAASSSR
jgi:hypothetical protein